jgi:hypothetical protein
MKREECRWPLSGTVEMLVVEPPAAVEKAVVGLARAVAAPVEEVAGELEKATAGRRRHKEGGRRADALGHGGDASRRAPGCRGER